MVLLTRRLHLRPRISIATSPDSGFNNVFMGMRFGITRDLHLKRYFAYYPITSGSREQHPKSPITMATKSENLVGNSTEEKVTGEKKDKKEEVVLPPPPPEKPEPGDCCGSGCVRCVWDVYYDELEEYNKLSTNKSN